MNEAMMRYGEKGQVSGDERSADKYIDAINAVIGLAEMAVPLIPTTGKARRSKGVREPR